MSVDTTELHEAVKRFTRTQEAAHNLVAYITNREAHIIKAISHHFALPEADLIKAINDYQPMEEK